VKLKLSNWLCCVKNSKPSNKQKIKPQKEKPQTFNDIFFGEIVKWNTSLFEFVTGTPAVTSKWPPGSVFDFERVKTEIF
jgi:hypothetical protein